AGDSSKGVGSKLGVLDESKGKTKDINEGAGSKPEVPNVSKAKSSDQENSEEEPQGDEFVHTPDDYVPTDDETQDVDDEEYVRINEELYDDVNVEMKDVEPADEGKGDEEMTDAEKVDAEHKEINQEVASAKVQDEIQATTTAAPATQKEKIEAPPSSSSHSVSSNYVPKSKTLSTIHLRVSDLEKEVKELKNVNHSTTLLATIKSEVLTAIKEYLGTSLGDALHKVLQRHTTELIKEHSVPADVIEVLKHQQKPQKSVVDIRKVKMEHAVKQQESQYTIKSSDKAALNEFDQKQALFETMTKAKSFNKHPNHMNLYHALMESILADEDPMNQGVADLDKQNKRSYGSILADEEGLVQET
ncbi:hypothetical protein Tco_1422730, partial [Tanacetum coccineum]